MNERFARRLGSAELRAFQVTTLQVNVGKKCNQACRHCHVDASPLRTEVMPDEVFEACLDVLARHPQLATLDITGGAPELHPRFREMVRRAHALERRVMVRHNLTVQFVAGQDGLPELFAAHGCELVCSLPHYTAEATDRQRGRGVYEASVAALKRLNQLGYGRGNGLVLTLISNPVGAFLPPKQADLERDVRAYLGEHHGIVFDRLFTITNMPIARFADWLDRAGIRADYMERLESAFNPATLPSLMCRSLVSVSWDGHLYDCDFNQMLELGLDADCPQTVFGLELPRLAERRIRTAGHCFGCTAGSGSSCGGAIA
ncbi:MAG TPA: arsenosugar biosynthesis radical SAM (seleno)protein ArsS [Candidatus Polarisedimenticolaceae bacterium]|nr:arsenosugar biosynthesis radical SAM (seleno)protein ArsS [Candidatus Polarisedimenticolaceae bacterium]